MLWHRFAAAMQKTERKFGCFSTWLVWKTCLRNRWFQNLWTIGKQLCLCLANFWSLMFVNWYSWADWVRGFLAGNGDDAAIFWAFLSQLQSLFEWMNKNSSSSSGIYSPFKVVLLHNFLSVFWDETKRQTAVCLSIWSDWHWHHTNTHFFTLSWCLYPSSLQLWCLTVLPAINRRKICCSLNGRDFS